MSLMPRLRSPLRRPARPWRWVGRAAVLALVVGVGAEAVRVVGGTNRHAVIPGRVYRCAQPSEADLREMVRDYHIRTVINLRGLSQVMDWYEAEARTLHDLNVSQEDITFSANRLPAPSELRRLIEVLDHAEYPIVFHCKQGADRTGLTAAVVLLLSPDSSLSAAMRQLWPRYGHFRFGRTAAIDRFFDLYKVWLKSEGIEHTPERFRHWALTVYTPGPARSELTWLDEPPSPYPANKPLALRVRAANRSIRPWEFKPGDYAGIHLSYLVADARVQPVAGGQAGLFRTTVPPGGSIDLTLALPPLAPGKYVLVAYMTDATAAGVPVRSNSFVQFGDESLMAELDVK
ncbi:MAG TPA: tyrosine-protein phosphatase [Fimbriiglobus sp.]|nr:tyrosine-protein phosphatase [Fimbriiglobus sp.]